MNLIIMLLVGYTAQSFLEDTERKEVLQKAIEAARQSGKPLLNAGCGQTFQLAHAAADVNLDCVFRSVPNFVLAPVEHIPFPDKYFGAVFCSHVIEHVADYQVALVELNRVADNVFCITPSPLFPISWLLPAHKRVFMRDRVIELRR